RLFAARGAMSNGTQRAFVTTMAFTLLISCLAGVASASRIADFRSEFVVWQKVLEHNPEDATALYNMGVFMANERQFTEAAQYFEHAIRIRPDYAKAHHNLGTALIQLGRSSEAIDHYREALRLVPDYPEAAKNLATVLAAGRNYDQAIPYFERVTQLTP